MPVFDLGYRRYDAPPKGRLFPSLAIAWRSFVTRVRWPFFLVLLTAAFPLFYKLVQVYASGLAEDVTDLPKDFARMVTSGINPYGFGDGLFFELISLEIFFAVLMLMVTGAGQIAEDFRTGALQIYFSRPIDQAQYVLGKLGTAVLSGLLVTLVPCIILFVACCAFAPDWSFLTKNPLLLLRVLGFSLLVSVVLGAAVLAISAVARNGRTAAITFAGGYFFSMLLGRVLPRILQDTRWEVVHLGNALDAVGRSLFVGGPVVDASADAAMYILAGIVIVSLVVFARKVNPVEVVS